MRRVEECDYVLELRDWHAWLGVSSNQRVSELSGLSGLSGLSSLLTGGAGGGSQPVSSQPHIAFNYHPQNPLQRTSNILLFSIYF